VSFLDSDGLCDKLCFFSGSKSRAEGDCRLQAGNPTVHCMYPASHRDNPQCNFLKLGLLGNPTRHREEIGTSYGLARSLYFAHHRQRVLLLLPLPVPLGTGRGTMTGLARTLCFAHHQQRAPLLSPLPVPLGTGERHYDRPR
jgi:hypothetical protein